MRASLTNLPFLGKISNGNVRYLNGDGGKYNNFRKSNALGRYTPLESQARYYSRCREEANLALGRSVYERGGGIDEKKEAQTKYERKGGKVEWRIAGVPNNNGGRLEQIITEESKKAYYDSKPREDTRKRSNEVVLRKKHRSPSVGTLGVERAEAKKGEGLVEMQQSRIMKRIEATEIDEAWTKFCLVGVLKDPKGGELLSEALFKGGSTPIWGVVRYAVMNGSAAMTFVMCCHECWFLADMGDAMTLLCCYDLWLVLIGDATAYEWEYCC
ncbi:hypothetical protein U1Q18_013958 [Sarracenia purpurea var. burkii]